MEFPTPTPETLAPGTHIIKRSDGTLVPDERRPPDDKRPDPGVGTVVQAALPAMTASAAMAVKAASDYGSMGLQGMLKTLGNATWMLLGAAGIIYFAMKLDKVAEQDRSDARLRDSANTTELRSVAAGLRDLTQDVRIMVNDCRSIADQGRTNNDLMRAAVTRLDELTRKLDRAGSVPGVKPAPPEEQHEP